MQRFQRLVCLFVLSVSAGVPASAADYYISRAGNDANAGNSPASPWQSLARVSSVRLLPGDRLLLRGGDVFAGGLTLDAGDAGSATAPIAITSYGTGRATIAPGQGAGISIYDAAGYSISNLALVGAGGDESGITFFSDLAADAKLSYVRIDSVDVSGFGRDGIEIGAWNNRAGFRDVRLCPIGEGTSEIQRMVIARELLGSKPSRG